MARYIDADKIDYTVTMVGMDENAGLRAVAFESDIDLLPTAEVAPKQRFETVLKLLDKTEDEVDGLRELNNSLLEAGQEWQKRYKNLAREIFAEIEGMFIRYTFDDDYISLCIKDEFAELKKKYTEGAADGDKQE